MTTAISVCAGYVRLAAVGSWPQAQERLRRDVSDTYPDFPEYVIKRRMRAELAAIESGPDVSGWIVANHGWCGMDTMRWARKGKHGLGDGDLAIVHDFTNGSRYAWTIDVKCKIIAVHGDKRTATVRITQHDTAQFTRGELVTLPVTFLRPRRGYRQGG